MLDSQIEEVKNRLNVIDVVGSYVKLTKTGANYRGVCPFHSEKKPSFFVSPARQMWHCFGCGAGSSIFDFVMKIEGVEFGDALKILATKAGIELKKENPKLRTERQRLYEICELACKFFEKQLDASAVGKEAKEYLKKRGIIDESLKKWRIGYSPDTWQSLSDFLVSKGYSRSEVVRAGLAVEKESNRADSYDRFRGRIIFPILDINSQVIGFGARVFKSANEKEVAKYINTPQTLLYDKSNVLYGLNHAKVSVRKKNQCVLTEGYTDTILCHQAGFDNTVAASGTALTNRHLDILKRYSENLLLAFDMDLAGDSATKRGINLAQEKGFNIKVVETYSKGEDPADIVKRNPAEWEKYVSEARSIMDYYFDSAFSAFDKATAEGKKEIGRIVLPAIKKISNKIEQSHWISKLAQRLGVKEEFVTEELKKISGATLKESVLRTETKEKVIGPEMRKKLIEEKIISLILRDPENLNVIEQPQYIYFSEKTRTFLEDLKKFIGEQKLDEAEEKDIKAVFANFADIQDTKDGFKADLKNFLAAFSLRAEIEYEEDGSDEVSLCMLQLKNLFVKNQLNSISRQIREAEQSKDSEKVKGLIGEFTKISKEL